jgi:hypothetical protein
MMKDIPLLSLANILHRGGMYNDALIVTNMAMEIRGAIHQLLNIILHLRIRVVFLLSTLPCVVKVKNYS